MYKFKIGDLVGIEHPQKPKAAIKTGIVVDTTEYNVMIQWFSYDKSFFMEKEGEIFKELNKSYLLSKQSYHRLNERASLFLLNSS
tara:strand:+ start:505 stop:759 length:255 start_codon:yes stop_codon:yes gene_type:complete